MGPQLLINAVTVHVESWYGTCPVFRLIGHWDRLEKEKPMPRSARADSLKPKNAKPELFKRDLAGQVTCFKFGYVIAFAGGLRHRLTRSVMLFRDS
jgi:hypothetical protein